MNLFRKPWTSQALSMCTLCRYMVRDLSDECVAAFQHSHSSAWRATWGRSDLVLAQSRRTISRALYYRTIPTRKKQDYVYFIISASAIFQTSSTSVVRSSDRQPYINLEIQPCLSNHHVFRLYPPSRYRDCWSWPRGASCRRVPAST